MTKLHISNPFSGLTTVQLFTRIIFVFASVIMVASAIAWWALIYNSPERTFWRMIGSSLSTATFTRVTDQSTDYQQVDHTISAQTTPQQLAHSITDVNQEGDDVVRVTTESLGTPWEDFIRYIAIETNQDAGANYDNVVNVWGKAPVSGGETNGQIYNQAVLNVFPFGNLNQQDRQKLINLMQETRAYTIVDSKIERSSIFSRPQYTFAVKVKPSAYIQVLQEYGNLVGLTQLVDIDPSQYAGTPDFNLMLVVDGWTDRISAVNYENGARVETMGSYGVRSDFPDIPEDAIPYDELQSRLWTLE